MAWLRRRAAPTISPRGRPRMTAGVGLGALTVFSQHRPDWSCGSQWHRPTNLTTVRRSLRQTPTNLTTVRRTLKPPGRRPALSRGKPRSVLQKVVRKTHFLLIHFRRMAFVVLEDKALGPVDVGRFGAEGKVLGPNCIPRTSSGPARTWSSSFLVSCVITDLPKSEFAQGTEL